MRDESLMDAIHGCQWLSAVIHTWNLLCAYYMPGAFGEYCMCIGLVNSHKSLMRSILVFLGFDEESKVQRG